MIESDLVIILSLVFSAFFSGMEIAFVSSNRIYLEIEKLQGSYTSKVLKSITQNPSRFIASMLLGNNVALVVYGIFSGDRILQLFFSETLLTGAEPSLIIVLYQTLISTGIILIIYWHSSNHSLPSSFLNTRISLASLVIGKS